MDRRHGVRGLLIGPAMGLLAVGCAAPPEGLRATPSGDGPVVVVDWDAEPLAELPFPNDLVAVTDATSPTGLRLNIPTETHTLFETEARHKINELTGFGIYAPITASFDHRLDIQNILDRHPDDLHEEDTFDDDAFFVVNVDPDSPGFGELVHLDVGHGRYPADVFRPDRYFANDTRADQPSIIFDTVDEDVNANGRMDPGEDLDNDGVLDVPNVWPPGAEPFENLLTFYDMESDTLIVRPVVPLREETTYAVVLTERLVGEDGQPVRSPWAWVHHTRQGTALAPVLDALDDAGVGVERNDIAFAWTFTTGRPTGDLRDIRRGLYDGEGPYPFLAEEYPAGVSTALGLHTLDGVDPYSLPLSRILPILANLDALGSGEGTAVLQSWFESFGDRIVGGTFTTPYLLVDKDEGAGWDADEYWVLDPYTGAMAREPQRVVFTCVLPLASEAHQAPFPVMVYGHGYGSSRIEFMLFAAAVNRMGHAACSFDFPGHGLDIGGDDAELARQLLEAGGLLGVLDHFSDSRARDLNNDGRPDSGGDQWTADPFHTRDMVRQPAVDWMAFTRALHACGEGTMGLEVYGEDGQPVGVDGERVSCDWDDDGVPDLGGPDADISLFGGSLGGINSGVAAAVVPDVVAWSPVVPAGGIVDVGIRTQIGGAVEAFVGRLISPLFVGVPDASCAGIQIRQLVNSVTDMAQLPVACLPEIPAGGEVVISNLTNGMVRTGMIPADGRFRVAIAADAMSVYDKALAAGIPREGPEEGVVYEVPYNEGLGDALMVEVYDAQGVRVAAIDTWQADVVHEGVTMPAGSPLVAGNEGNGKIRGSSEARRLAYISALILEPGDPIAYAPHYVLDPFQDVGAVPQNVLIVPTPGDDQVPINAGIAMARAAGFVDWKHVDPRYGVTQDRFLIDRQVIRGVEERGPWRGPGGDPLLFDADDLDDGTDDHQAPSDAPLRATVLTESGASGLRLPYVSPTGIHGFREPDPGLAFDINTYSIMMISDYLRKRGSVLEDKPCYEDGSCPDIPQVVGGAP